MALFVIKSRLWPPADITESFAGKTVIVTGANVGVGYEAALKYVKLGAGTVILAVRSLEKGGAAKEAIEKATHRPNVVQVWELDMDSYSSMDAFGKRVDKELMRLDVALLNAGVLSKSFVRSADGWEKTFQVNTLSTALLALLLLPKLKASSTMSSPSHLTLVTSTGHRDAEIDPAADKAHLMHHYNTSKDWSAMGSYSRSKLFVMWWLRELAKRCVEPEGSPQVIINDTCPGPTRSDITRDFNTYVEYVFKTVALWIFFKPTEQGARAVVGATTLGKESYAKFWAADSFDWEGDLVTSDEGKVMQGYMWDEIIGILEEKVPRVTSIVAGLK